MNLGELCVYACMALCYPKDLEKRTLHLWSMALNLFRKMTMKEEVEAYLRDEKMQAMSKKYVSVSAKVQTGFSRNSLATHIIESQNNDQKMTKPRSKTQHDSENIEPDIATTIWDGLHSQASSSSHAN
jgi:hypothetical protein